MNIKNKYEKTIKALLISQKDMWNLQEHISPLEISFQTEPITEQEVCIAPNEPNFQLPNVFLKSKKNPLCQKLIDTNASTTQWNKTLDEILALLDEIDFVNETTQIKSDKITVDSKILENILKIRYGYTTRD